MIKKINHNFDILEKVYHITGDSPGYILEWIYSSYNDKIKYRVVFNNSKDEGWYDENELSDQQQFNFN